MKLFTIFLTLILGACAKIETNQPDKTNQNMEVKYDSEEYIFTNEKRLVTPFGISAKKIIFQEGTIIKLNQYDLNLTADTIEFGENVFIIGFERDDYNLECEQDGRDAGSLTIKAKKIRGFPILDLKGENAGRHGLGYYTKYNRRKHHPDDVVRKGWVKNPCQPSKSMNWHTITDYWLQIKFNGGDNGNLNIFYDDYVNFDSFFAYVIEDRSYGNLVSTVHYKPKGKRRRYYTINNGERGQPSQFCLLVEEQEFQRCFKSYLSLIEEVRYMRIFKSLTLKGRSND